MALAATFALLSGTPTLADDRLTDGNAEPPPAERLPASIHLLDLQPRPAPPFAPGEPASRSAARVLETLGRVRAGIRTTRYQHNTVVRERDGLFAWDCSGMAAWVMSRSAPRALASVGGERPVARDFYRAIMRAPIARARGGWQRLERISDARPGDVFAWLRPLDWPPRNTGHVGFVLAAPVPVPWLPDAYVVRVADATSIAHQDDTRANDPAGGYGEGTLMFLTDGFGHGNAYAWHGTRSGASIQTNIVFGRLVR
jgi:hypothetical protein